MKGRKMPLAMAISLLFSTSFALHAQTQVETKEQFQTYVVQEGDTLWSISEKLLSNPLKWHSLWERNQQIADPNRIYPEDTVNVTTIDNKIVALTVVKPKDVQRSVLVITPSKRYMKYKDPIPMVNYDRLNLLIKKMKVMSLDEIMQKDYIVGSDADELMLDVGKYIYTHRNVKTEKVREYGVYRPEQHLNDTELSQNVVFERIGKLRFVKTIGALDKYKVVSVTGELMAGHLVLPEIPVLTKDIVVKKPEASITARIVHIAGGVGNAGLYDTLLINVGREKVSVGNILGLSSRGKTVRDPNTGEGIVLPNVNYGTLLVVDVYDGMALTVVIKTKHRVDINDVVTSSGDEIDV
jgi:hypothetical protein